MYIPQKKPEKFMLGIEESYEVTAIITLKDEYGGISHIFEDDSCLVLANGSEDRPFKMVYHWYPEAVMALVDLIHRNPGINK